MQALRQQAGWRRSQSHGYGGSLGDGKSLGQQGGLLDTQRFHAVVLSGLRVCDFRCYPQLLLKALLTTLG
jgi:hypothetical protein